MPQFLSNTLNNETVSLIMAIFRYSCIFSLTLHLCLYLGAIAISGLVCSEHSIMIMLLPGSIFPHYYFGMKVIGYTDVIQVAVLIIGGLATIYFALTVVSNKFGV